jgi:UDP-galactopyranose mutase
MTNYDYTIIGAGLTGATIARLLTDKGKKVIVIEKNPYVGGACHDRIIDKLPVCDYSGHIFHTNNEKVWSFVNRFSTFIPYEHRVVAYRDNKYYPIPINLQTLNQLYGIHTVKGAKEYINHFKNDKEDNFEEIAISRIGKDLYEKLFKDYTTKQWGIHPKNLPASIFSRLPVRYNLDTRYFSDRYQAMPIHGYTRLVENILGGIEVRLDETLEPDSIYDNVIYTGSIDEYYAYLYGKLNYRSSKYYWITEKEDNFGGATVNYVSGEKPFTRTMTFNHFYPDIKNDYYVTAVEFPDSDGIPLYPIPTEDNIKMYNKYKKIITKTIFAGRLGSYKYMNMDVAINDAMEVVNGIK